MFLIPPEKIILRTIVGIYNRLKSKILTLLKFKYEIKKIDTNKKDIYIIHHLACTGGTLISKLIRDSFNCILVSEINPGYNFGYHYFSPTNLLSQFSVSSGKPMRTIKKAIEIYNESIDFCLDNIELDQFLVIRDWSEGDFYHQNLVPHNCSTKDWIDPKKYNIHSIISVRHPIESFISKLNNSWEKIDNQNAFEIYCKRYLDFLNHYAGCKIIYYEDICSNYELELNKLSKIWCKKLKSIKLISKKKMSGDSGRSSLKIDLRKSKNISKKLRSQINSSNSYIELCKRLGYKSDIEENSLNYFK